MEKVQKDSSIPSPLDIGVDRPEQKQTLKQEYQSRLELERLNRIKENEEIVKKNSTKAKRLRKKTKWISDGMNPKNVIGHSNFPKGGDTQTKENYHRKNRNIRARVLKFCKELT